MFYRVKARYKEDKLAELYRCVTSAALRQQEPDGREIIASMERARVTSPGVVEWSEICFCPTPLRHERATVYDQFFYGLVTEPTDNYVEIFGENFMDFLASRANSPK